MSAMTKMLYYIRTLFPAERVASDTEATDWSSRFAGAWKDTRSADEIVADIRAARNFRHIEDLSIEDWLA